MLIKIYYFMLFANKYIQCVRKKNTPYNSLLSRKIISALYYQYRQTYFLL